jgi:hypothetical protein
MIFNTFLVFLNRFFSNMEDLLNIFCMEDNTFKSNDVDRSRITQNESYMTDVDVLNLQPEDLVSDIIHTNITEKTTLGSDSNSEHSPMTIDSSPEACLVSLSPSPKSFSPNSANSDTDCANKSNTEDENPLPKRNGNCPPDGNLLPPCRVCDAKASGLHYGANTCEPCKVSYTVKHM